MISPLFRWSVSRTSPIWAGSIGAYLLLFVLIFSLGCISKPIQIHTLDAVTGAPIANVDIRQHGARFFHFIPESGKAPKTNANGQLDLVLNARATSLAVLRPGYVPTQVSIVPAPEGRAAESQPRLMVADISPSNYIEFESLADHAILKVRLTPTVDEQVKVCVRNEQGMPLAKVEVIVETVLFLPKDGLEGEWGRPPIQRLATDASGCAVMTAHLGLQNYIYLRMIGCESQRIALERLVERKSIEAVLRSVTCKPAVIRVIDCKTGAPIAGAAVELGKEFDGVARDPNGWSVKTDANGCTPQVSMPDFAHLIVAASAEKYFMRRQVLNWKALDAKKPFEIGLDRKP